MGFGSYRAGADITLIEGHHDTPAELSRSPGDDDDASRSILPVRESMRGVGGAKLSESARMWVSGHAVRVFISDPS